MKILKCIMKGGKMRKIYDIVYSKNEEIRKISCLEPSLKSYIQSISSNNGKIMYVLQHTKNKEETINIINFIEKKRYYDVQKKKIYMDYKKNVIDLSMLLYTINILDRLSFICTTPDEFRLSFEKYKKTNNYI